MEIVAVKKKALISISALFDYQIQVTAVARDQFFYRVGRNPTCTAVCQAPNPY